MEDTKVRLEVLVTYPKMNKKPHGEKFLRRVDLVLWTVQFNVLLGAGIVAVFWLFAAFESLTNEYTRRALLETWPVNTLLLAVPIMLAILCEVKRTKYERDLEYFWESVPQGVITDLRVKGDLTTFFTVTVKGYNRMMQLRSQTHYISHDEWHTYSLGQAASFD